MTYNIPALVTSKTTEMVKTTTIKKIKLRNKILNTKDRKCNRKKGPVCIMIRQSVSEP